MENPRSVLSPIDALFLQRAYELGARGVGSTAPNPPVGAVVVRDGRIVGEGYHQRAGSAHAELTALQQARGNARGATVYLSLEPCGHWGRTPPCVDALIGAGVARIVAGAPDPSGHGGAEHLRGRGIDVVIANERPAAELIERFARTFAMQRPYVAVKMAMSLDGAVARQPGVAERIGSEPQRQYVRELRMAYDAVLVGAETVRIDDPQLTLRPPHDRRRPYVRIVASESAGLPGNSRVFASEAGYDDTIVLVPDGARQNAAALPASAQTVFVGASGAQTLDLPKALRALWERGIYSVLCEGGPRLAASLIAARLVDRFYWALAPVFLSNERAVPVLAGVDLAARTIRARFERVENAGGDVVLSGRLYDV